MFGPQRRVRYIIKLSSATADWPQVECKVYSSGAAFVLAANVGNASSSCSIYQAVGKSGIDRNHHVLLPLSRDLSDRPCPKMRVCEGARGVGL